MNLKLTQPRVIHEDNHLIVIDKPPELATMGVQAHEESLVTWAKAWLKKKYNKPGNVYLGVVSRLDSFTTGLIVLAKTSKAASRMTRQFQTGMVEKTYLAILEHTPGKNRGKLVDWVLKNDSRRRMEVVHEQPAAKRAELNYSVAAIHQNLALVEIELVTGRKHQIRVQFSSRGMPVLGDRKYDADESFPRGIALHANSLAFEHPVRKERMSFTVEPPKYWNLARFERN